MTERAMSRIGAVALVLGLLVLLIAEPLHPSREDPLDHPAVFAEYARSDVWIGVHLGEYLAFLLLLGGVVSLTALLSNAAGAAAAWARIASAAAVTATGAFTILQAVDGIALKRAVDAWLSAPAERKGAALAAAEAIRWVETGVNALAYGLLGLTIVLVGLALVQQTVYPRWLGWLAVATGVAFVVRGTLVAYRGFAPSFPGLAALALFVVWALSAAFVMWRDTGQRSAAAPRRG